VKAPAGGAGGAGAPLRFFEGFSWPLPLAFASAVSANRFEQGDVLFRHPASYEPLEGGEALAGENPRGFDAIQVLNPPRSARATPTEVDGDRRRSSWQSEVTVALVDLARGESEVRTLSQGKLVMALWHGDEAWLDPARPEPLFPRGARELHAQLAQTLESFDAAQRTTSGCRFVYVVDLASDASRTKAQCVEEALRAAGTVERIDRSPQLAGVEHGSTYHPALSVRCLVMPDRSVEAVQPILRACLYGGGVAPPEAPEAAEGAEAPTDRFSVSRHGLLEPIGD
jgi:hypothetical protein